MTHEQWGLSVQFPDLVQVIVLIHHLNLYFIRGRDI